MDFSLSELKAFCAVAEAGKISSAARAIGITQPALSLAVKRMESSLGVPLFFRGQRGVKLTRAGQTLLARSRELLRGWDQLKDAIHADEQEIRGTYTIGVHGTIATYILPLFFPNLLMENPAVELRLVHDLSRNISESVIEYKVDFGIVVDPPKHQDLVIIPLYRDEFKMWVGETPTALSDIAGPQGLIASNPLLLRTATIIRDGTRSGLIKGARLLQTTELELIANLAAGGHAVGVLPATIAQGRPGPKLVPLKGTPVFKDVVCLIYRHDTILTNASRIIKQYIVEHLKDKHPEGV